MNKVYPLSEHHPIEEKAAQPATPVADSDNTAARALPPSDFEGEPKVFCQLTVNRRFLCDRAFSGGWGL